MRLWSTFFFGLLLSACAHAPPDPQLATSAVMAGGADSGWHEVPLPGKARTRYTHLSEQGSKVVQAESASSASMLRRLVRVEPASLGRVSFSWRVQQLIATADLSEADTSDSPVRLILAFEGDNTRLSMRNRMMFELAHAVTGEVPPYATLMYVWDNKAAVESVLHDGRSDRIRKIVLESGQASLGAWRSYERDIAADFRRTFGEEPGPLIAVGLMTDSDNTRSSARAWYGDVKLLGPDGHFQ